MPYAAAILSGAKRFELRRKFSRDVPKNTKLFLYVGGAVRGVLGECKIKTISRLPLKKLWSQVSIEAMISWDHFSQYFQGLEYGFAIEVSRPKKYPDKLSLSSIKNVRLKPPQSFCYF